MMSKTRSVCEFILAFADNGKFTKKIGYYIRGNCLLSQAFTAIKQEHITNETLAKTSPEWEIIEYLVVGKSDYLNEVDKQVKIKADLFEERMKR